MAVHYHSNYGKTSQHKNINGPHATEVTPVAVGDLVDATDGYKTERQKWLHVLAIDKNVGTNLTVTLYGYTHAFGKWFPLKTRPGDFSVSGSGALTMTVADSGAAEGAQTADNREMMTFEISGIDRVGFVGTTAHVRLFAACSTI